MWRYEKLSASRSTLIVISNSATSGIIGLAEALVFIMPLVALKRASVVVVGGAALVQVLVQVAEKVLGAEYRGKHCNY